MIATAASFTVEAERLLDDASPLVRGAAVWALSQLLGQGEFEARAVKAMNVEADDNVRAEWRLTDSVGHHAS